ncbi:MAG: ornithine carbamoyltransferase [Deltaproteobacteria bacterium RBG_13_52_11]|nr:MAG: ornithine carbamoyltransferase [Deltaproteobacteria bacterium RBG_13_52_11]
MKKDLISIYDLKTEEIESILHKAKDLKEMHRKGVPYRPLEGKTLAMIFEKPSTRTRVSFEVGMYQLGGHALSLSPQDTQLGRGEAIADTARVLSRYVDGIMIRTFAQERVEEMARFASIPVINGLSDLLHPCQILSDIFTIEERRGQYRGLKVAYVGDGNNVANSWINGALRLGFDLWLACPPGYEPNAKILLRAQEEGSSQIILTHDPKEAVEGAHVINTDVWASMGQEGERAERIKAFQGYQVNADLVHRGEKDVLVMHCLPAHRGEEITDEVMDGPHSVVFDQAENRLHVQKAILTLLMGKGQNDEQGR